MHTAQQRSTAAQRVAFVVYVLFGVVASTCYVLHTHDALRYACCAVCVACVALLYVTTRDA